MISTMPSGEIYSYLTIVVHANEDLVDIRRYYLCGVRMDREGCHSIIENPSGNIFKRNKDGFANSRL